MRVNSGKGYLVEKFDTDTNQVTVSSDMVEVYFPEALKKASHLNRYPVVGDVILLKEGVKVLLIAVWREENADNAQNEHVHGEKILNEEKITSVKLDETETTFMELFDQYEKNEANTMKTLEKRELRK